MASHAFIFGAILALPLVLSRAFTAHKPARTTLISPESERVVIIGASSGIGSELARIYAERHAHLILVARRLELLQQLSQELCPSAGSIHIIQADVTLPEDVSKVTLESLQALDGRVDTLIICAGVISVLPFEELAGIDPSKSWKNCSPSSLAESDASSSTSSSERFSHLMPSNAQAALEASQRIMNVNYHAPLNLTSYFLPALKQTGPAGNIIVVSSMAGKISAPTRSIYCGSKHAAQGFFDALGMEVERSGVHVSIVSPGTVSTDLRNSAVDLPPTDSSPAASEKKEVAGTKKGAISARACAEGIVRGSDLRLHNVVMPWFYHVSIVLQIVSPSLVRWLAKKKYGYL